MTTKAKPIIKDKFWIVEQNGARIGTISVDDDRFLFSSKEGVKYYDNKKQLERRLGKTIFERDKTATLDVEKAIQGYPTSTTPYNAMYDVKKKLPLYTKSPTSKSVYCAGYYIIQFNKGWVRSFCPKLVTIEQYNSKGPFLDEATMKQELSYANK